MVANMVFRVSRAPRILPGFGAHLQGFMKGYISHEKQMVVLAKTAPFPNLNTIAR